MATHLNMADKHRLRGALGSLEQAVTLLESALNYGKCPLSATSVRDAEKLAEGAGVLLGYVVGKGDW